LAAQDVVEFAHPNYYLYAYWTPNDPYFWDQWNLDRYGALDMPVAWELGTGNANVRVAVVDCGVAYEDFEIPEHERDEVYSPDGRYHRAPDLASTRFASGYDFVNDDEHANDESGHGTHVTGTIAQSTNNGLGVAGMAFDCTIVPVRVLDNRGRGELDVVAEGIVYASEQADVINLSLGGQVTSQLLEDAVTTAADNGAVIVAATGNDGANQVDYPAAYPQCIAVGAVDYWWEKTPYSNWGSALDLVAPGGDTRSENYWPIWQNTFENGGGTPPVDVSRFTYKGWEGTSMATPHVAALAAMMKARGIDDPDEIRSRLYATAIDLGAPGWDTLYGHGLIEPVSALGAALRYHRSDNGRPQAYYYVNDPNGKFAVKYTPSLQAPYKITGVMVPVSDDSAQRQFRLSVNPAAGNGMPDLSRNLAGPVTFTTLGDQRPHWYDWDFDPVTCSDQSPFFVVFHHVTHRVPYLAGDSTNSGGQAYHCISDTWYQSTGYNWYLRAVAYKDTLHGGIAEARGSRTIKPSGLISVSPQPARDGVTISYCCRRVGPCRFLISDAAGRVVRELVLNCSEPGVHSLAWDGRDESCQPVPRGIYFLQAELDGQVAATRVVVMR
ncbi:MAG: S8 family serine peptidase, partial [candidate division WOR-3 bacterium]